MLTMTNVYDVSADELIKKTAEELKKNELIKKPSWADYVKTSAARERFPVDSEWWYVRAASLLRKMYVFDRPIGTNRLRNYYGGRKNRGHKPERFYKGSGKIIRVILQQLEKAGYLQTVKEGVHKGREITGNGKKFLDGIAKHGSKRTE